MALVAILHMIEFPNESIIHDKIGMHCTYTIDVLQQHITQCKWNGNILIETISSSLKSSIYWYT